MAFWCRIKQSKLQQLSYQFKRSYFHIHAPRVANYTASNSVVRLRNKPDLALSRKPTEFSYNARFFAAPVQTKPTPKQEERNSQEPRLNGQITAEFLRLVTDEGHCVVSRREALERARKLSLDLVEVQRNANPPVCKLMNFHKEKYIQQVKDKDRAKSKSEVTLRKGDCKEVRFSGKTELKDLKIKADLVKRLMERGYRVKCMATGNVDQDLGEFLSRFSALIEDVSVVESEPRVEKRQAHVIVRHVKFGPLKKGSGKKASPSVSVAIAEPLNATSLPQDMKPSTSTQNPVCSVEDSDTEDSNRDIPISPLVLPTENHEVNRTAWPVVETNEDFDQVFDFSKDVNKTEGFTDKQMNNVHEESSSADVIISELLHPRTDLDSMQGNKVPRSPPEPPFGSENRYRRSEPSNRFSPTKSRDNRGSHVAESSRFEPQFPNQGKQLRLDLNSLPSEGDAKRVETDSPLFRNLSIPNEVAREEPSHLTAPSPPMPSYGIFSTRKANAHGGQGVNSNSPTSKSDDNQRQGIDKNGQGKWGIFSKEGSNVIPDRTFDSQAKLQR